VGRPSLTRNPPDLRLRLRLRVRFVDCDGRFDIVMLRSASE
jgi:hypothetical protein